MYYLLTIHYFEVRMFKGFVMYWLFSILLIANAIFNKTILRLRLKKGNFFNGKLNNV